MCLTSVHLGGAVLDSGCGAVAASNLLFMLGHMCYGIASINRTNCCWPGCLL